MEEGPHESYDVALIVAGSNYLKYLLGMNCRDHVYIQQCSVFKTLRKEEHVDFLSHELSIFLLAVSVSWVFHYSLSLPSQDWQKKRKMDKSHSVNSCLCHNHIASRALRGQGYSFHLWEYCAAACIFSTLCLYWNLRKNYLQI